MPKKKSLIRASIEELDTKNAIGQNHFAAKQARREQGEKIWAFCTEHYQITWHQKYITHFLNWGLDLHHLNNLKQVKSKSRADELASQHLHERIEIGKSAYTLTSERSTSVSFSRIYS